MRYNPLNRELILEGGERDYIQVLSADRYLAELYDKAATGKGKNSFVYSVIDPNGEEPDYVVKFCNYHDELPEAIPGKKRKRFEREIQALEKALEHHKDDFLLNIIDNGRQVVDECTLRYYVMEKADCDLSLYLVDVRLSLQQKILLCSKLIKALEALHNLGIYHRDLKPDNLFLVGDKWKIGDLGFIAFRDEDYKLDARTERIGPTGSMSPEAINKAFANRDNPEFDFDYMIDDKSDVFQLGKLFWYIFQGNIPTGQLVIDDFRIDEPDIFNGIILPMLQYAKSRRPDVAELDRAFNPIRKKYVI